MQFTNKRAALTAAFVSRLTIGVIIGAMIGSPQLLHLGTPGWEVGLAVGLLVSAPDALRLGLVTSEADDPLAAAHSPDIPPANS